MWLINTTTLELHDFVDHHSAPPYAILSHCWGEGEVSFKDFRKKRDCAGPGLEKIVGACEHTRRFKWWARGDDNEIIAREGLDWLWVDTCCIDKRSSSELTEAINSMYSWYQNADICFAYLADVDMQDGMLSSDSWKQFYESRWFTRGWTLQELIAPSQVVFLDARWQYIGVKREQVIGDIQMMPVLAGAIEEVTRVPARLLTDLRPLQSYSVAQRMSWASSRSTTRTEDIAYCLLGLFSINMPLLYGEGTKAFRRLQHEILRRELGESLFAWRTSPSHSTKSHQLFASSPALFAGSADVVDVARRSGPIFSSRGHWIELRTPLAPQRTVFEDAEDLRPSGMKDLMVRLACGRWESVRESRVFVPCVLLLTPMLGSQHLLRHRGLGRDDYFGEDDVLSLGAWMPVVGAGTKYILMHSDEAEPRRWAAGTIDIEDTVELARTRQLDIDSMSSALLVNLTFEHDSRGAGEDEGAGCAPPFSSIQDARNQVSNLVETREIME